MSLLTEADLGAALAPEPDPWSGSRRYLYTLNAGPRPDYEMAPTSPVPVSQPRQRYSAPVRRPVQTQRKPFFSFGPAYVRSQPRRSFSGMGDLGADDWLTTINEMGETYDKLKPMLDFIGDHPVLSATMGATFIGVILGMFSFIGARLPDSGWL